MLWGKKALRVSAVVIVALAAGHAAETLKAPVGQAAFSLESLRALPTPEHAARAAADPIPQSASLNAPDKPGLDDVTGITTIAATVPDRSDDPCQPILGLSAMPGAMLALSLAAPCNANQRVVIRHAGLAFTAQTDGSGRLSQVLPGLREDALVAAYLEGSQVILGRARVPDAADFTRVALIWDRPAELELRVTRGEKLMVGSRRPAESGAEQVLVLGTPDAPVPVLASVYSVAMTDLGNAEISAELRITPATCGRTLRLTVLTANRGAVLETERLVPVPLCGTSGNILVLKNLVPALKLATPK